MTTTYAVRVRDHHDDHWGDWFDGFTVTRHDDGTSTLTGVADQAQLHGVLTGLRDIGAELQELRTVEAHPEPALPRPLRTGRLTLRAGRYDDAEPTWAYRRLASVNEWLAGGPGTFAGYQELFARPDRLAATVVVELHDGTVVGDFMLRRHDAWSQTEVAAQASGQEVELGWVLDPAHAGRGHATEATRELLRYCFVELQVHRVTADCFLANETSWRLMERLGMRRESHTRRDALHRSGQWLDSVGYALLADEWHQVAS